MDMGGTEWSAAGNDVIDNATARALRFHTLNKISTLLNPMKVLSTDDGILRDWRGLAQLAGLDGSTTMGLGCKTDPTGEVLKLWISNKSGGASIQLLKSFLSQMDRWDIIDDTSRMIEEDVKEYTERMRNTDLTGRHLTVEADEHILTVDDVCRLENGLQPQCYDAFLLYAEEDVDFSMRIVDKMEKEYGLKLCVKDRDLVGGLAFEHGAIMKLIAERCNRLIVVVSPNFLRSEANKFFLTFAQALGIEQRRRKVVPCLYQRCQLPPELSYYFLLDFNRVGKLWNVWEKLRDSIQAPISSDNRLQESRSWVTQLSVTDTIPNANSPSMGNSQTHLLPLHQQDPPPPYSKHHVIQRPTCNLSDGIPSSSPEYCNTSIVEEKNWNKIPFSVSDSNLASHLHFSENSAMSEQHGSEFDVRHHSEVGKDKGKPFRWFRKLLPKEGKRRKHKKKALCN